MHMADALLSPAVGASFWLASGSALAWCVRTMKTSDRDDLVPLMGVLGAFVFAVQMINFTIPGTGSSGHLGGGLLLAILLGPQAAFLVIASVLTVQALFFADGGLLALGANLFNIGLISCLVVYPLVYRPLMRGAGTLPSKRRIGWVALLSSVIAVQLGALGVVMQTHWSGISSLPVAAFIWLMQPIHLAIGIGEGLATAALIVFVRQARPDLLAVGVHRAPGAASPVVIGVAAVALLTAAVLSWFASSKPDGLEWAIAHTMGVTSVAAEAPAWPAVDAGASLAGVVGGTITLFLVLAVGYWFKRHKSPRQ
ncbi:energy-coupling factor ABC transporter permease [Rhodoferax sp.]|uniref:energy-coupling factor ABC transporter permease n=1 Tax=Rhodoferax sp. TaxID=50421 RepID=UPI0019F62553|nr:energy-coupling factor ABC transporter permease [Rhodoferax sp.]MBE0472934.1 energy-coupling factor ABC transporter permease [Rhodoferax sp.]